jgi:uncharacterized protein (TIGR02118 family)
MSATVQVLYPVGTDTHFDYDYYAGTHLPMVEEIWGAHLDRTLVTKGLAGGPDTPPGFYVVASLVFKNGDEMQAGMAKAGPLLADIPNFTNSQPQMLMGEVIG